MGSSKNNKVRFFQSNPNCCFCGGGVPATTIDHIPSRQMFNFKRRPAGLEFPACNVCNQSTKNYEQLFALISRIYPDIDSSEKDEELKKILSAVARNNPGVLESMLVPDGSAILAEIGQENKYLISTSHPDIQNSLNFVGSKIGMGLYYDQFRKIVPVQGGVLVIPKTNFDMEKEGGMPDAVLSMLNQPNTLSQGRWSVADQFEYACGANNTENAAWYTCTFRRSFLLHLYVTNNTNSLPSGVFGWRPSLKRFDIN